MDNKLNILLVEDSETDADLLLRFLKKKRIDFSCLRVWSKGPFIDALRKNNPDLIIADHTLPHFSGIEAFRIAKIEFKNIPFILITGTVSEQILTEYAKEGVDDYILKENLLRLPSAIEHVINKKKIEQLNRKLELANNNINDSITYAKRIQNAMLPDISILSSNFPDSFILFKPKDILSGDFYWFRKDNGIFLIAVSDCTGHGIPGALLSMIGLEKLNNLSHITNNPSEILRKLNESIQMALCQTSNFDACHDGMDISLCSINLENKVLKFAGANRPLWIIHSSQRVIEEIKGNSKPIGGLALELSPDFKNNEVKLQPEDSIYIFSDGYSDQFGGENNKKLTTHRFRELLLSIQNSNMKEQKEMINHFFEEWKSGVEQVDDILIIGIRLNPEIVMQ